MSASAPRRLAEAAATVLMGAIGALIGPATLLAAGAARDPAAAVVDAASGLGLVGLDLWLLRRALRTPRGTRRPHAEAAFHVAAVVVLTGAVVDRALVGRFATGDALAAGLTLILALMARRSLRHVLAGTAPARDETALDRSRREWREAMAALKELRRR